MCVFNSSAEEAEEERWMACGSLASQPSHNSEPQVQGQTRPRRKKKRKKKVWRTTEQIDTSVLQICSHMCTHMYVHTQVIITILNKLKDLRKGQIPF